MGKRGPKIRYHDQYHRIQRMRMRQYYRTGSSKAATVEELMVLAREQGK